MNERRLGRFLKYLVLLSVPLPVAFVSSGCGGSSSVDPPAAGAGGASVGASGTSTGGSGGDVCHGVELTPPMSCSSFLVTVPLSCIDRAQASPGTPLTDDPGCAVLCNPATAYCAVDSVTPQTQTITVTCGLSCGVGGGGRRPAGLQVGQPQEPSELGGYFAELAHLEAASVAAFRVLRDELWQHGAPKKLIRQAGRAARDEVRHARATAALARRFGARPRPAQIEPLATRSLEAMAVENAVEGCVRETFGALQATWQARAAGDPVVRATMMRIARDETKHAALSWSVAQWLDQRLTVEARQRVEIAKQQAVAELMAAASSESVSYGQAAGLPSPRATAQLVQQMQRTLWS